MNSLLKKTDLFRIVGTSALSFLILFILVWPVSAEDVNHKLPYPGGKTYKVTQGNNSQYSHNGKPRYAFDFGMNVGSTVVATAPGKVVLVKENSNTGGCDSSYANYANYVVIEHSDGYRSLYLHLKYQSVSPSVGESVQQGEKIAESGQTGWACGSHLHYQLQEKGSGTWWEQSVPVSFSDVTENGGVPTKGNYYTSGNYRSPQNESLVRVDGEKVYWLQNGILYHVIDFSVIDKMSDLDGWGREDIYEYSQSVIEGYETGAEFIEPDSGSEGILIREVGTNPVYRVNEDGDLEQKSESWLNDPGTKSWDDVIEVTEEIRELFSIADPDPESLEISGPSKVDGKDGNTESYTATLHYTDGSTRTVNDESIWNGTFDNANVSSDGILEVTSDIYSDESGQVGANYTGEGVSFNESKDVTLEGISKPDIPKIIEEHKTSSLSLNVEGKSVLIVNLDCRIDPENLECKPGRAKVYLNSEGMPISKKVLAQKVGLIDLSRDLKERVGSPRMISRSIQRLDRRLRLHTLIKIGELTQSIMASTIATLVRAYATQGATLKKDTFSDVMDLAKNLATSPYTFVSLLARTDFRKAKKKYRQALDIAQKDSFDTYQEAEEYLDSLYTAFANDFPARHVLDRIDDIDKTFGEDMKELGSQVVDELVDNEVEKSFKAFKSMLEEVKKILSSWGYMKEKNNFKPYDEDILDSKIAKERYDTRYTLKLSDAVAELRDETAPDVSITSDLSAEIDRTEVRLTWRGRDDKTNEENLKYYYSLEGPVERSGWTGSTAKSFTSLSDGEYVFKVKAKDKAGNTSTAVDLNFEIKTGVGYDASFVKDVTIPDGTRIKAGQSVDKVWRLKNTGTENWSGCSWQFIEGDKIGGPDEVKVTGASPGENADISVELTPSAGSVGETLVGYWQLFTPDGRSFGPKCWVSVGVDRGTPKTDWSFDSGSKEGWVPNSSVASHTVTDDPNAGSKVLALDPFGKDPWIENRSNVFFESSSYNTIHIRMASNAPDGAGSVYFHRSGEGFNQDNSSDFSVANHSRSGSAPYCNYYVNLGNMWSDKITGLRVDPCANGDSKTDKDTVAIDYIKVKSVKRSTPSLDLLIKPDQNEFEPGSTQKKEVKIEGKGYTVKNYVRVTKPSGKKVWAFYPNDEPLRNDFDPSSQLSFSDTKRPLYNCTRIVSNFTWHWDTYTFNSKNQVGKWKWEYWIEDVNNPGEKLAQDSETYQVSQDNQSNNPPTANSDTYTVPKDSSENTFEVLSNDSDPDGDQISLDKIVSGPSHGSASIDGDLISYTPDAGYTGSDSLTYEISDTDGATDTAQVDITVEGGTTNAQLTIEDAYAPINQTAKPKVKLSKAPDGLKSFNIWYSIADTSVAEFTGATISDQFSASSHVVEIADDGRRIKVAAGDFGGNIDPGDIDIRLATLEVKVKTQKTTTVSVDKVNELLDENGSINADTLDTGKVGFLACSKVKGGKGPPKSNHGKPDLLDDVNGDGTTNSFDAFVLFKAKAKGGPVVTNQCATRFDFNEDGKTNSFDAFVLFKKIAKGEYETLSTTTATSTTTPEKEISGTDTRVVEVNLDHVPKGLVGYKLTTEVPNGAVEAVELVAFDEAKVVEGLNSSTVTFAAADFDEKVEPGNSEVTLARLKVKGDEPVKLTPHWLDDDTGSSYDPKAVDFTLKQVDTTEVPLKLEGASAYPNPLTDQDSINFTVNGEGIEASRLQVFALSGKTVHDSGYKPGDRINWSLKDKQGSQVSNGIYLYTITAKGFDGKLARSEVRRVLVLN